MEAADVEIKEIVFPKKHWEMHVDEMAGDHATLTHTSSDKSQGQHRSEKRVREQGELEQRIVHMKFQKFSNGSASGSRDGSQT